MTPSCPLNKLSKLVQAIRIWLSSLRDGPNERVARSDPRFIRKGLRGRQRANIASRCTCEKMYGGNLFDVQKKRILEKDQCLFRQSFIRNRFGQC